jgi:UDP-N-acetylmuramate: L-alanyl-gamma-D-glutamyl-meso-diaminopimelate ligase
VHLHILGICGTFMGGIALLARTLGHDVTGSDANVYPPMSDLLAQVGITLMEGYEPEHLNPAPDVVVVGNALSRGNPAVEHVLNENLAYTSGPQWLAEHVLGGRWVLAVAGTHGKTTASSMLAWVLETAGLEPGFLVGGVPENFGISARLGGSRFMVVEADEYDTAFFDKRSKFVHYRPRTLVLNNLEYDHADIFPDLAAIQRQFHHLVRTVPGNGRILHPRADAALDEVLAMGCWTPLESFGLGDADWQARLLEADGSVFDIRHGDEFARVEWELIGEHNVTNALATVAAAHHAGVPVHAACRGLGRFRNVKRRLELCGVVHGITLYDDFAHHPTAIRATLAALRQRLGAARIIAVLEPRSNTMRMGIHRDTLMPSLGEADRVLLLEPPGLTWSLRSAVEPFGEKHHVYDSVEAIIAEVVDSARPQDHIVVMSNGGFGGIHGRLIEALNARYGE